MSTIEDILSAGFYKLSNGEYVYGQPLTKEEDKIIYASNNNVIPEIYISTKHSKSDYIPISAGISKRNFNTFSKSLSNFPKYLESSLGFFEEKGTFLHTRQILMIHKKDRIIMKELIFMDHDLVQDRDEITEIKYDSNLFNDAKYFFKAQRFITGNKAVDEYNKIKEFVYQEKII